MSIDILFESVEFLYIFKFRKFSAIISFNIFILSFLFFPFGTSNVHMLDHLLLSHRSLRYIHFFF